MQPDVEEEIRTAAQLREPAYAVLPVPVLQETDYCNCIADEDLKSITRRHHRHPDRNRSYGPSHSVLAGRHQDWLSAFESYLPR